MHAAKWHREIKHAEKCVTILKVICWIYFIVYVVGEDKKKKKRKKKQRTNVSYIKLNCCATIIHSHATVYEKEI